MSGRYVNLGSDDLYCQPISHESKSHSHYQRRRGDEGASVGNPPQGPGRQLVIDEVDVIAELCRTRGKPPEHLDALDEQAAG